MNDYYTELDETPAYYTSAILNAVSRQGYFENTWTDKAQQPSLQEAKKWPGTCGKKSRNRYHFLQYLARSLRISV
jgi:hypothetical protein